MFGFIAAVGSALVPTVADTVSGWIGGGSDSEQPKISGSPFNVPHRCPGSPTGDAFKEAFYRAPQATQDAFIAQWNKTNGSRYMWTTASADWNYIVYSAWGGNDCNPSSTDGKELFRQAQAIMSNQYQTGSTGTAQEQDKDVGDYLSEILKNLGRAGLETATATVSGGLQGGVAASEGAAAGARAGATLFNSTTTLLLLLAVAFLAFKAFSK